MRSSALISIVLASGLTLGCDVLEPKSDAPGPDTTTDSGDDTFGAGDDTFGNDTDDTFTGSDGIEGTIISDLGYRPDPDGYSFQNYSRISSDENYDDLNAFRLRNMFGNDVCSTQLTTCTDEDAAQGFCTDTCVLTPQARDWMTEKNRVMQGRNKLTGEVESGGGHCFGFAVSSQLTFADHISISHYDPSATTTYSAENVSGVQQYIAVWMASQWAPTVQDALRYRSPNDMVAYLSEEFDAGRPVTLGVLLDSGRGGHAITPFAISELTDGNQRIYLYDNNHPGQYRYVEVDPVQNTYLYDGGGWTSSTARGNMMVSWSLAPQSDVLLNADTYFPCDFCESTVEDGGDNYDRGRRDIRLNISGDASVTVMDDLGQVISGRGASWDTSEMVTAVVNPVLVGADTPVQPSLTLTKGVGYTMFIEEPTGGATSIDFIDDGVITTIAGIEVGTGEAAQAYISADGHTVGYLAAGTESPRLSVSTHHADADYKFTLDVEGGEGMEAFVTVDESAEVLVIDLTEGSPDFTAALTLERHQNDVNDVIYFPTAWNDQHVTYTIKYGEWSGAGAPLEVEVDLNADGTVDFVDTWTHVD